MAYITPSQFLKAYDSRRIRELLSDTGTPVADADVNSNTNLAQILAEASEEVAAAALVGKRYTTSQLESLAASSTTGFMLRRLVADLAVALVVSRRGAAAADIERLCPRHREALRQLEMLRTGAELFPFISDDHAEAGLPATVDLNAQTNTNRITTFTARAARAFPFDCRRTVNPNDNCC